MTLTRTHIERSQHAELLRVAGDWRSVATRIEELFDRAVGHVEKAGDQYWEGTAADAAQQRARADRGTAYEMAGAVGRLVAHAEHGYHQIEVPMARARSAILGAEGEGFIVTEVLSVEHHGLPLTPEVAAAGLAWQSELADAAAQAALADNAVRDAMNAERDSLRATFTSAMTIGSGLGSVDGAALVAGAAPNTADPMSPEQLQRLAEASTLAPEQLAALEADGVATIPASQMGYLTEVSRALDGKSPQDIERLMRQLPPGGQQALANSFQILSNPRISTGAGGGASLPGKGGIGQLPDKIRESLLREDLISFEQVTTASAYPAPARTTLYTKVNGIEENQAIAAIVARSDPAQQVGSDLDRRLLDVGRVYLSQQVADEQGASTIGVEYGGGRGSAITEPILQAVGADKLAVEAALADKETGPDFVMDLLSHQWTDDGRAASALFHSADGEVGGARAGNIMEQVAGTVSTTESWDALRDIPGANGQSAGQVNPELLRTISHELSPYALSLAGVGQPEMPGFDTGGWADPSANQQFRGSANVFALMGTDDEAGEHFNASAYGAAAAAENIYAAAPLDPEAPNHLDSSGRLLGLVDRGLLLTTQDEYADEAERQQAEYDRKSAAYDAYKSLLLLGLDRATGFGDVLSAATDIGDAPLRAGFIGEEPTDSRQARLPGPDFYARYHHIISVADIPEQVRRDHAVLFLPDGELRPYEQLRGETSLIGRLETVFNKIGASDDGHGFRVRDRYAEVTSNDG